VSSRQEELRPMNDMEEQEEAADIFDRAVSKNKNKILKIYQIHKNPQKYKKKIKKIPNRFKKFEKRSKN
jgi:hypothetical protein